jgi:hypothetical protein
VHVYSAVYRVLALQLVDIQYAVAYDRSSYARTLCVFETESLHVISFASSTATLAWPTIAPNVLPYLNGVSQSQL